MSTNPDRDELAAAPLAPICLPCQEERSRWLDTRPSQVLPRFGFAHGSGAPYDVSAAGIRDRGRARHEEWRKLVRSQRDLIARRCREAGHMAVDAAGAASGRALTVRCLGSALDEFVGAGRD